MDEEKMFSKNNVLFVGNGIDLLAGYKTDYMSFLKHYEGHYTKYIRNMIESKLEMYVFIRGTGNKIVKLDVDIIYETLLEKFNTNYYAKDEKTYLQEKGNNRLLTDDVIKEILNIDLPVETETVLNPNEKLNTWISYFLAMYYKNLLNGKNWIDLENLILQNVIPEEKIAYSYKKHVENMKDAETEEQQYDDFLDMKKLLVNYLHEKKKVESNEIKVHDYVFSQFGTILNFNYSTSDCLNPKNRYSTTNSFPSSHEGIEIYIHGMCKDLDKIVFGFDDGIIRDSLTKRSSIAKESKKYSKTSQLLTLSTHNYETGGIHKLPLMKNIKKIGILGHGIGKADYNYFETLVDFETVIIEVFWYKFRDVNTGEKTNENNKQALMDSLINMIHEMEERKGMVILHKMLIEHRIVFREFEYKVNEVYSSN